ncbi:alpha-protein kinase 1-like [Clytia hemisphaerica]|uniref:alpha-protein kinase 1-like n=1 Tax=Clytia hemisphaerica TaxID=252671 RepID=UPI0034D61333|eukprot:TCONS_00033994-protein
MHMAAKAIADRFFKKINLTKRENWFSYKDAFFATLNGEPVTVEPFVAGKFTKYINNDGVIGSHDTNKNASKAIYEKAEALCHFSYEDSADRLMLADLQGSGLILYDPEIATAEELEGEDLQGEKFFCGGNLNDVAIDTFFRNHKCNIYLQVSFAERSGNDRNFR